MHEPNKHEPNKHEPELVRQTVVDAHRRRERFARSLIFCIDNQLSFLSRLEKPKRKRERLIDIIVRIFRNGSRAPGTPLRTCWSSSDSIW